MDEYLSKPLKHNHLIQTILKCATLGGQLLEKGRDTRTSPKEEGPPLAANKAPVSTVATVATPNARPGLESRAYTTTGPINHGSLESPAIVAADQDDPLARVRSVSYPKHI
jgi:osomolarity two-component system sensor histidine kinase NIK1